METESLSSSCSLPPDGPVLVVSPHLDDAALSCAALLDRVEPVDVLTVFSGLPDPPVQGFWDRLTGFANSAESIPVRREEDRDAFSGSNHRLHYLDLLELQYAPNPRAGADGRAITRAVSDWVERNGTGTVAVPAGAGFHARRWRLIIKRLATRSHGAPHPDHLLVRDAAVEALRSARTVQLLLYEELPYAFDGPADREIVHLAGTLSSAVIPCSVEINRDEKARRISSYRSQVPHLWGTDAPLDTAEALPGLERYWLLQS